MWDEDLITIALPTVSTIVFFVFTVNFFRYLIGIPQIQIRDVTKEHNWKAINETAKVLLRIYRVIIDYLLPKHAHFSYF